MTPTRFQRLRLRLALCAIFSGALFFGGAPAAQESALTVRMSPAAGTFAGRQKITLSVQGRATIHYTLDGTLPTTESPVYKKPFTVERSVRVRAMAFSKDGTAGPVVAESYLRVASDSERFTSHLPIILIHTFESGALNPYGSDHVPAVLQVFEPRSGTSRVLGRATLDARIGMHVRGASSRNFWKRQYAIELRADDSEADRAQSLLGLPSHADWVLSDPVTFDRTLVRNALAYEMSNAIGRYAPRTRFAEVFLVDDGGEVRAESFLGFFTLIEKIARGPDRVDVRRLPASAATMPEVTGGFILSIDKGVPDFAAGGRRLQFVYPDADAMRAPERQAQAEFISGFINDFAFAASAPDFRHPVTRQPYSDFIDVDAWIDHHILNVLTKNIDALRFSAYFHKDRGGRLAAGPVWDFDRSLGTPHDARATEPEEWKTPSFNATDYFNDGWWRLLFRNPEFRARYVARFRTLLRTDFSANALERRVDRLTATVGDAAQRNFRRWPQYPPLNDDYAVEVSMLKDFLRRRVRWIDSQLETISP